MNWVMTFTVHHDHHEMGLCGPLGDGDGEKKQVRKIGVFEEENQNTESVKYGCRHFFTSPTG